MGAKAYVVVFAAVAACGCAGGLKRFAPPGIVKYEDLAKGQPVSPSIAARVEAAENDGPGAFPVLSAQPGEAPAGIAAPERAALGDGLVAARADLLRAIDADRATAAGERIDTIEPERDALGDAIRNDDAAARRERGLPPLAPDLKD